jgi:hypothetical protein
MPEKLRTMNKKAPGQLILSTDWNDLTGNISSLESNMNEAISSARKQIEDMDAALRELRESFTKYRDRVEPVIGQFYQVSISTSSATYALGELADIKVQVTDPLGGELVKGRERGRPWVDFVATWGQLKAAPGFDNIVGQGGRSVSVRVNDKGIAQVLLRSDHVAGFSDKEENDVAIALQTQVPGKGMNFAKYVKEAATPLTAKNEGALHIISQEYERKETPSMQHYTDAYYLKYAPEVAAKYVKPSAQWHDYPVTVLAFAKSDSDPATPDRRHGAESITVTFRDWITPWIHLEYLDKSRIADYTKDIQSQFRAKVTKDYATTTNYFKQVVTENVMDAGLIGKIRTLEAMNLALDSLEVTDAPDFLPDLATTIRHGVVMQHVMESAQASTIGLPAAEENIGFQTYGRVGAAAGQVSGLESRVEEIYGSIKVAQDDVAQFKSDFASLQKEFGSAQSQFGTVRQTLDDVQKEFRPVQDAVLDLVKSGGKIDSLQRGVDAASSKVDAADTGLRVMRAQMDASLSEGGELGTLRKQVATIQGQFSNFAVIQPTQVTERLADHQALLGNFKPAELLTEIGNLKDRLSRLEPR